MRKKDNLKLKEYYQDIISNDETKILNAATYIRKELSAETNPPIQEVIDLGIASRLIKLLSSSNQEIQYESCWAITNILSGSNEQCLYLVQLDVLTPLILLLKSSHKNTIEQAIWAIGNISGNDATCRNLVLNTNVISVVIELLDKSDTLTLSLLRNICWTIQNFCRGKPKPIFSSISVLLPYFERLLVYNDDDITSDICWSLSWISDTTNENLDYILRFGNLLDKMIEYIYHPNLSIQVPALRFIGNILTGDDHQTQRILTYKGVLPHFVSLLNNSRKGVRKETCWALSNAAAGNQTQIQILIDNQVFQHLFILFQNEYEIDIIKEALWCLCNAIAGGNPEQILYLVQLNCISHFSTVLNSTTIYILDNPVLDSILDSIERILLVGRRISDGTETNPMIPLLEETSIPKALKDIQINHPTLSEDVEDKLNILIETYFDGDEEEEMQLDIKKLNITSP